MDPSLDPQEGEEDPLGLDIEVAHFVGDEGGGEGEEVHPPKASPRETTKVLNWQRDLSKSGFKMK